MTRVPFNKPSLVGNEINYIREAVALGQLAGDGAFTKRCHEVICRLSGAPSALMTHSGTAALEMISILCNFRPGDEVIMPSFTFVSTANAVVLRGATPVFVDICDDTLNIDPEEVEHHITPRTKAIIAVHYAGVPADMDAIHRVAKMHGLFVIEDAAQALGSSYKGHPAGSLGDMAAFSFHETKNIICGEGGAITINRDALFQRAEIIREKGTNRSAFFRDQVDKYTWVDIGSSYLPGELTSAYLFAQLEREAEIKARRLKIFERYQAAFADVAKQRGLTLPHIPPCCEGNGHMFFLRLRSVEQRAAFIKRMKAAEVITPYHYVPLHSSPAGQHYAKTPGRMSVTDMVSNTLVRLPMYFDLDDDFEKVVEAAHDALANIP